MKEYHKSYYTILFMEGKLFEHLAEIDETCHSCLKNMITVSANEIPRESAPLFATEEQIILTENLMADILIEVQNGMGYAEAKAKSSHIIFNAVILNQTNGNGFGILSAIARKLLIEAKNVMQ